VVLEAAGVARARLLLVTAPAAVVAGQIARLARGIRPGLEVIARAESAEEMASLHEEGVDIVVQPQFEAGLQITRQALLRLGLSVGRIHRYTDAVRRELYLPLRREDTPFDRLDLLRDAFNLADIVSFTVEPGSPLAGKSLAQSMVRTRTGAVVVGLLRHGQVIRTPPADFVLQAGDEVAVMGEHSERDAFSAPVAAPGRSEDL